MQLTLTNRLRLAALKRAEQGGRVVGTYVIDDGGVIDLRALEDRRPRSRASDLAPLDDMAGMFGEATDVSDLYAPEEVRRRGWFRRRPADQQTSDHQLLDLDDDRDHAADDELMAQDELMAEDELMAQDEFSADDEASAETPIPASDPVAAGDRVEVPADRKVAPRHMGVPVSDGGDEVEPEPAAPIRGQQAELSSLQSAIMEFNQLEPAPEVDVVDIDSGIIFGASGKLVESGRGSLFEVQPADTLPADAQQVDDDVIDLRENPDLGAPAGPIQPSTPDADQTDGHAEVADPSSPGPLDDRDDQTPAATSGGDDVVCPACGGAATKDFTNRFLDIDFYSCDECFNMWHLAAEEYS